jgi:hypothetical protein
MAKKAKKAKSVSKEELDQAEKKAPSEKTVQLGKKAIAAKKALKDIGKFNT